MNPAAIPLFTFDQNGFTHAAQTAPQTLAERFAEFDRDNPHVYREIERRALLAAANGAKHIGVKAIVEALRWSALETTGTDYKINNSFPAFWARMLVDKHPHLRGLIELRESVADEVQG